MLSKIKKFLELVKRDTKEYHEAVEALEYVNKYYYLGKLLDFSHLDFNEVISFTIDNKKNVMIEITDNLSGTKVSYGFSLKDDIAKLDIDGELKTKLKVLRGWNYDDGSCKSNE